jgi:hypothetical protein
MDTSALAKLYVAEPESDLVSRTLQAHSSWLATSRVTYAEMLSVLNRCLSGRRLSTSAYKAQKNVFFEDWSSFHVIELTAGVLSEASRLIESHALRGLDAIHLCSALSVGRASFACFDDRLRAAAALEGLDLAL